MIQKVISGGQTGADLGGVLAARLHHIKTGGWMPNGWKTLNGARPEYAKLFDMQEHPVSGYKPRTWANANDSDGTVRFACNFDSPGEKCTLNGVISHGKKWYDVPINKDDPVIYANHLVQFSRWLRDHDIKVLNVAGNSHNTWGGMQSYTCRFLSTVFFSFGFNKHTLPQEYNKFSTLVY